VRAALQLLIERHPELEDGDFALSRQVNLETIHNYDVVAERQGTLAELRAELRNS
jgi:GTP cyclohydrolase-4